MGCRIIVGRDDNGEGVECACFYDSVTETVFGEKMEDLEEAESFQEWAGEDLRRLTSVEFSFRLNKFRDERKLNKNKEV